MVQIRLLVRGFTRSRRAAEKIEKRVFTGKIGFSSFPLVNVPSHSSENYFGKIGYSSSRGAGISTQVDMQIHSHFDMEISWETDLSILFIYILFALKTRQE